MLRLVINSPHLFYSLKGRAQRWFFFPAMIIILKITLLSTSQMVGNYLYRKAWEHLESFLKKRWIFSGNDTCWKAPQKRWSLPHGNNTYLSQYPAFFFCGATMSVLRDSCCVPLDAHQQTTALVTGNHSTAATTGPYLHKLPQNT